ncbi:MAG: RIP metalloprotease RseP [Rickettsia endosymbiont of Pseudomimeciton antennatum]|nr:RIP metalloprotease RseP [Rickettsia endosymbiont of Pseudomimeciton antennatum]MCC8397864.1 RIP metalloprotease RseP [Rickettsia endosymbiont of Labidopullus appendiculatus]
MLSIFGFILTISLLVFIHEFGHYYVAKMFGVKVEEFSIGFGKELFSKIDKDGVKWKICALPFGGYVKIYGFDPATLEKPKSCENNSLEHPNPAHYAFLSKPLYAQFLIIAAGPIANYLLAILIFTTIYFSHGQVEIPPIIGEVVANSPAELAGLAKNDKIIIVNNNKINSFADLQSNLLTNGSKPLQLLVERNGEVIDISIIPIEKELDKRPNLKRPYIGIIAKNEPIYIKMNIFQSIYQGSIDAIYISNLILKHFGQMLIGTESLNGISGPITIAKESGKSLEQGVANFALFIAMISINLGLLNLLPIPVLDGGHLAFIIYQTIFGKTLSGAIKNVILRLGMGIIIFLIVISLSNDIKNLVFK